VIRTTYDVNHILTLAAWRRLAGPLEQASDALARLDERLLRAEPVLADGCRARSDVFDAQATVHLGGGLVALEDLVLHDAAMDVRRPTPELTRAAIVLSTRRCIAASPPGWPLSPEGFQQLLGVRLAADDNSADQEPALAQSAGDVLGRGGRARRRDPKPWEMPLFSDDAFDDDAEEQEDEPEELEPLEAVSRGGEGDEFAEVDRILARTRRSLVAYNSGGKEERFTVYDPGFGEAEKLDAWRQIALHDTRDLPPALAAAVALDAWLAIDPSQHRAYLGPLLAASILRARRKATSHLPAMSLGLREAGFRWHRAEDPANRLAGLAAGIEAAARHAQRDLDKLALARELMLRRCVRKRKNSRLPALVDLFVSTPLVAVATAAKALKTTPQAIEAMLDDLGSACTRELTHRRRYRAWGIV
jgi:hypothetical protein